MLGFLLVVTSVLSVCAGGRVPEPQYASLKLPPHGVFNSDIKHSSSLASSTRILGGKPVNITAAPYNVAILLDYWGEGDFRLNCGGAILTSRIVLTAAHCVRRYQTYQLKVRAGSSLHESGGQTVDVLWVIVHEDYDMIELDYDVAIVMLSGVLRLDGVNMAPVALFEQDENVNGGVNAIISGWGSTAEAIPVADQLHLAVTPIVDLPLCISLYGSIGWLVTPRMICAGDLISGGIDACAGDSGGPMVVEGRLAGLTSWGYGCGRPGYPGVWTRIPSVRNWIDNQLKSITY